MEIIKGEEERYANCKSKNTDDYGQAVFGYAERIADSLEVKINDSNDEPERVIMKNAKEVIDSADVDYVSGAMYEYALRILDYYWKYGKHIRKWQMMQQNKAIRDFIKLIQ